MSGTGIVATRYAKSLFDLAKEQGQQEVVFADMAVIAEACRGNRDLVNVFNSPVINTDKKKAIVEEVFKGAIGTLTMAFLNIILTKRREHYVPGIAAEYLKMYNLFKGIETASVTTAVPLDEETRNKISAMVHAQTGKEVQLTEKIDADIIGGFILRFGDKQIDTSVSGKIRELGKEFDQNLYVKEY
ncbi:MAG: ATP synthase F1 subunit delta [Sphingobacteriales bacterium JAD_PAG50586_3]|nr:MAG: ATP synthase F1 subunit delta [Sphingobacteriales bacterium JAD_PAG50586_3]